MHLENKLCHWEVLRTGFWEKLQESEEKHAGRSFLICNFHQMSLGCWVLENQQEYPNSPDAKQLWEVVPEMRWSDKQALQA